MWDETDLVESFEGEEGKTTNFPLLGAWWALVFILHGKTVLVSFPGKLGQFG
jgi:hypothetical protein